MFTDAPTAGAVLGFVGTVLGLWFTFRGSVRTTTAQAAMQAEVARQTAAEKYADRLAARVEVLEKALDTAYTELAGSRESHIATVERLLDEEAVLRRAHAEQVEEMRERCDSLRLQNIAFRSELLRRNVNPDRVLGHEFDGEREPGGR